MRPTHILPKSSPRLGHGLLQINRRRTSYKSRIASKLKKRLVRKSLLIHLKSVSVKAITSMRIIIDL